MGKHRRWRDTCGAYGYKDGRECQEVARFPKFFLSFPETLKLGVSCGQGC